MIDLKKIAGAALAFVAAHVLSAARQLNLASYPSRPIRLIVPFPAGGSSDILGRIFAEKVGAELGQTDGRRQPRRWKHRDRHAGRRQLQTRWLHAFCR